MMEIKNGDELNVGDILKFKFNEKERVGIVCLERNNGYRDYVVKVIYGGFEMCHNCNNYFKSLIGVFIYGSGISNIKRIPKNNLFKLLEE